MSESKLLIRAILASLTVLSVQTILLLIALVNLDRELRAKINCPGEHQDRAMSSLDLLQQRRQEILAIAAKHGAYDVRVFGSIIRGEERPDSDIDLLVKRGAKISRWFPAGLILGGVKK